VIDRISLTADTDHFPATMGSTMTSVGRAQKPRLCEQLIIVVAVIGFAKKVCKRA
jgi:hypothetical protein